MSPNLEVVCPDNLNALEAALRWFDRLVPQFGVPFGPGAVWDGLVKLGFYVTDQPAAPGRPPALTRVHEARKVGEEFGNIVCNEWLKQGRVTRASTAYIYARSST